jgi:lipid-A-disaccharide synthase
MGNSRKILVIAGEVSGDRIAASALRKAVALGQEKGMEVELYGIGGEECRSAGVKRYFTADQMQVVGFLEVAKKYRFFKSVFADMKWLLDDPNTRPDVVLLVDYPGFNIRFAREARARGIRVVYYVSPQVWAWKPGRIKQIVECVDTMLVVFPFEVELYKNAGMKDVQFIGHPLVELLDEEEQTFETRLDFASRMLLPPDKPWLVLFPGSRTEEVERHLSIMVEAAQKFAGRQYHIVVVKSPSLDDSLYVSLRQEVSQFRSNSRDIHELMHHAALGILKSGTTTLEAGLAKLPGVICYKTSMFTYQLARSMMKLKMIGVVNIVLGKKVYPELIQNNMSASNINGALTDVTSRMDSFSRELRNLRTTLRLVDGVPSERVANVLLQ